MALFDVINTCIEQIKNILPFFKPSYNYSDIKLKVFSDNFFFCSETGYLQLLFFVSHLQAVLTTVNVFIRGALCYNDLIFTDDFIYGKGMIEAHDIESKIAIFPRLIIDDSFFSGAANIENSNTNINISLVEIKEHLKSSYFEDFDGNNTLDYLEECRNFTENSPRNIYPYTIRDIVYEHGNQILNNLNITSRKIHQKYCWCKKYHNKFCSNDNLLDLVIR